MCAHIFWIKFVNSGHSVSMFSQRKPSPPSHIAVNYTFHYCRSFQILSKNFEVNAIYWYFASDAINKALMFNYYRPGLKCFCHGSKSKIQD